MLEELRLQLARERGVPACIVFTGRSLIDMVRKPPRTNKEFAETNGTGAVRLKDLLGTASCRPPQTLPRTGGRSVAWELRTAASSPAREVSLRPRSSLTQPSRVSSFSEPLLRGARTRRRLCAPARNSSLRCHNHTMEPRAEGIRQVKFPDVQ